MEVMRLAISAARAYEGFCDVESQKRWVPGLKRVKVVRASASGRPLEVFYEFGESLAYALVYAWDDAGLKARWVPSSGVRDGVSGSVWFETDGDATLMHYQLEALKGRPASHEHDAALGFASWLGPR